MQTFRALAEPNRLRVFDALRSGPKAVNDLVSDSGLSQPLVSKHLKILREANLVSMQAEGTRRVYAVNAQGLQELAQWLDGYRHFWADRLDALGAHLNQQEPS